MKGKKAGGQASQGMGLMNGQGAYLLLGPSERVEGEEIWDGEVEERGIEFLDHVLALLRQLDAQGVAEIIVRIDNRQGNAWHLEHARATYFKVPEAKRQGQDIMIIAYRQDVLFSPPVWPTRHHP